MFQVQERGARRVDNGYEAVRANIPDRYFFFFGDEEKRRLPKTKGTPLGESRGDNRRVSARSTSSATKSGGIFTLEIAKCSLCAAR